MEITTTFYPQNRKEWRNWLKINHKSAKEIWLIYYKKQSKKPSIKYNDAVEEAICFGWIDSTVKSIDNEKYCQRFTPRNCKSKWSQLNKIRVAKLISEKKITKTGLQKIDYAKNNGLWELLDMKTNFDMPEEFTKELNENQNAKKLFNKLSRSHKNEYIKWICSAKKKETKIRRSKKAIQMIVNNLNTNSI